MRTNGSPGSPSPTQRRLPAWDPSTGEKEKAKRRALRETSIDGSAPTPVVVVTKKEVVANLSPSKSTQAISGTKVVKVTSGPKHSTKPFEAVKRTAKQQKETPTVIYGSGDERLSKIQGKEYLPPGYLELEPMLLKDEFEFIGKPLEKAFEEDQRKVKELRRKQYGYRNSSRVRDFVVYRIDHLRGEAKKILDRWYNTRDDVMPSSVQAEFSDLLGLEQSTFRSLHDAYLRERRGETVDSKTLNEAIYRDANQSKLREAAEDDQKSPNKDSLGAYGVRGYSDQDESGGDEPTNDISQRSSQKNLEDQAWKEKKRQELIEKQKKGRIEDARRKQEALARTIMAQSEAEIEAERARKEAEIAKRRANKLAKDKELAQQEAAQLAKEKEAREREMLRARRVASKEKDKRSKAEEDKELLQLELASAQRRLQELEEENKRVRDEALKKPSVVVVKGTPRDRSKEREWRERAVRAEIERERAERELEENMKKAMEERQKRLQEQQDEELLAQERERQAELERLLQEREREAAEEQLKRSRAEAIEQARRQRAKEAELKRREEEKMRRLQEQRDAEKEYQAQKAREESERRRQRDLEQEEAKLKKEREELEVEKRRWRDELEAKRRREEERLKSASDLLLRQRVSANPQAGSKPKLRFVEAAPQGSNGRDGRSTLAKSSNPWSGNLYSQGAREEEDSEDDDQDRATLATLDYDVEQLS